MGVGSVRWDAFNADPNPPCVVLYFIIKKFRSILDIVKFFDIYLCIKSEIGKCQFFNHDSYIFQSHPLYIICIGHYSQLSKTCAFYLINVNY